MTSRGEIRLLLREGAPAPGSVRALDPRPAEEQDRGRILACAACQRPITTSAARIEMSGSHAHTFANPEGRSFRIGCFSDATGVVAVGAASRYWTWFPGHSWQIELCAGCAEQLGWLFRSRDSAFHGLILDRLVELDEPRA